MNLRASWGTILIHAAAIVATLYTTGHGLDETSRQRGGAVGFGRGDGASRNRPIPDAEPVRLFLASKMPVKTLRSRLALTTRGIDQWERPCPESGSVDADAMVPSTQDNDPLGWVPSEGENATLCALIDSRGRVVAVYVSQTSGDASQDDRLLRSVRNIRFVPAQRHGRSIGTWHRLIVNKPLGIPVETPFVPQATFDSGPYFIY